MALSTQQRVFVEAYLTCWNATEAARKAGYSKKTARQQASRLLANPEIKVAIDERLKELKMTSDEVLLRLSSMARADMRDFIDITSEGAAFINLTKAAKKGKLHLLKKVKHTRDIRVVDEVEYIKEGMEIELHDAQAALVHIGRHYKLFTDKHDHESGGKPIVFQIGGIVDDDDGEAVAAGG